MAVIYLWGNNAILKKDKLQKELKMKWSRKKRRFYRDKTDARNLKKIMNYCMKNKINYKTDTGQSYEVIESDIIETSQRELKEWGEGIPKPSRYMDDFAQNRMWGGRDK